MYTYLIKLIDLLFVKLMKDKDKLRSLLTINNTIEFPNKLKDYSTLFNLTPNSICETLTDYTQCFYDNRKGYSKPSYSNNQSNKNWKKDDEANDFFDNFKGKFNQAEFNNFKRNIENEISLEASLLYNGKKLIDNKKKIFSVDDFFDVEEEAKEKITEVPFVKSSTYLTKTINECINFVNDKLNYPLDKPLWYIFHEGAESSYGPLSSKNIIEMLDIKMLNENSKIRLIDVFVYRGKEQFKFFQIKDIRLDNFHDNIKLSDLVKYLK